MAKKVNYTPYIIGVAAVGGIVLWQSGKLDKLFGKKTDETPELPPLEPETEKPVIKKEIVVKPLPDPTKNPVYMDKVRKLQLFLGAGVDGNAGGEGSQTNIKTKAKFPALYANLGRVTPANVDAYLAETTKKTTTQIANEAAGRKKFGQSLYQLGATGKRVRPKSTITAPIFYYDSARKQYVPSTRKSSITNYHLFSKWDIAGYDRDGYFILKNKLFPKDFVIVNPYSFEAV